LGGHRGFEQKIQATLARIWGNEDASVVRDSEEVA
jgi:hypothetical protein